MDLEFYMSDTYCINIHRIYATGKSNGGGFVNVLACSREHGNMFAAFAPIIGAFYSDANDQNQCHPSRSHTPMLEIRGYLDADFDCKMRRKIGAEYLTMGMEVKIRSQEYLIGWRDGRPGMGVLRGPV